MGVHRGVAWTEVSCLQTVTLSRDEVDDWVVTVDRCENMKQATVYPVAEPLHKYRKLCRYAGKAG